MSPSTFLKLQGTAVVLTRLSADSTTESSGSYLADPLGRDDTELFFLILVVKKKDLLQMGKENVFISIPL